MNVRTLRLSTLGACLLALGAVALNTSGDAGAAPPPPPPNGNGGIIQSCGPDVYTYCYGEFWDSAVTYQSTSNFPIAILFNGGSMETCCDYIQVYDGLDNFAPLIGQYTAYKSGHALNNKLARTLLARADAFEIVTFADAKTVPTAFHDWMLKPA
jgi:hypothetical protein